MLIARISAANEVSRKEESCGRNFTGIKRRRQSEKLISMPYQGSKPARPPISTQPVCRFESGKSAEGHFLNHNGAEGSLPAQKQRTDNQLGVALQAPMALRAWARCVRINTSKQARLGRAMNSMKNKREKDWIIPVSGQCTSRKPQVAEVSCVRGIHGADIIDCAASLSPVPGPEPIASVAQ